MSGEKRAAVSLGADVGGEDAYDATNRHILALRRLLANTCLGPYSKIFKEIALVLRIDGSVQAWGKSGVEGIVFRRKSALATADIYIPRDAWEFRDAPGLKSFLASAVNSAIVEITKHAKIKGLDFNHEELERDVRAATQIFTSSQGKLR